MPLDITSLETYKQRFVPAIKEPHMTLILIFLSCLAPCRHFYIYNSKEPSATGFRQLCYIVPPIIIVST